MRLLDLIYFLKHIITKLADTYELCDKSGLVEQKLRNEEIVVHYSTVASGNQVMRDAAEETD